MTSRYLFVAILSRLGHPPALAYGCLVPTERPPGWGKDPEEIKLGDDTTLHIGQTLVAEAEAAAFLQALDKGTVEPGLLGLPTAEPFTVQLRRRMIGPAFGHSAAVCQAYCTLPDLTQGFGPVPLPAMLKTLQDLLGIPFGEKAMHRLGSVEVFDLGPRPDQPEPYEVEAVRANDGGDDWSARHMVISRSAEVASRRQMAHLVCWAGTDRIVDTLVTLEPDHQHSEPVVAPEPIDEFECSIFSADGTLVFHERNRFMRTVDLTMAVGGDTLVINDRMTQRASGLGVAMKTQAAEVRQHWSQRSRVGGPGAMREWSAQLRDIIGEVEAPTDDRWFPPGNFTGWFEVLRHMRRLLDGGTVKRAILVDPFFDNQALVGFLFRLESRDVALTVVTSWTDRTIRPDGTSVLRAVPEQHTTHLRQQLRGLERHLFPNLSIINLVDGKDQAFHDRYLVLYPHEGLPKVFLLSNSFNNMADKWPFCMSLLAPPVARHVRAYVEGLAEGRDITGKTQPVITYRWPEPEDAPSRR